MNHFALADRTYPNTAAARFHLHTDKIVAVSMSPSMAAKSKAQLTTTPEVVIYIMLNCARFSLTKSRCSGAGSLKPLPSTFQRRLITQPQRERCPVLHTPIAMARNMLTGP